MSDKEQASPEQKEFIAIVNMSEAAAALILKGLNQLPTGEAGDFAYLFKQTILEQKTKYEEALKAE